MHRTTLFLLLVVAVCLASPVRALDAPAISWAELAPPPVEYENPFNELTAEQMDGLRRLVRLQSQVASGESSAAADASALQAELESSGLDVDGLLAKRLEIMMLRRAATNGVNELLIGKTVRIPGYVLPLEFVDQKAVEFLLVPTVGACIHTPPPAANQLVHVRYPQGVEIRGYYDPVWIGGQLAAENSVQAVRYVDGERSVETSYFMQPVLVEPYR
jgi:hypothetical protein